MEPTATAEPVLRPMTAADLEGAEEVSALAFLEADRAGARRTDPEPTRRAPERAARWITRTARTLETDPGGCWVLTETGSGRMLGFATSMARERLWVLATFAVRPGHQGRGLGRRLLDAAEGHARATGCDRAMLSASQDPRALARYHRAGFVLVPQMRLRGRPRAAAEPDGVRDGVPGDHGWMDDLDRRLRGGPHARDHVALTAMAGLRVDTGSRGYVYATDAEVFCVAAEDTATASRLLADALARASAEIEVGHISPANGWATALGLDAGLLLDTAGYLGVRGMAPPAPYLHHGALL